MTALHTVARGRICATNPVQPEFSLCGDAFDGFDSGDLDEPVALAETGERITCERCRLVITQCKRVKHWREPEGVT